MRVVYENILESIERASQNARSMGRVIKHIELTKKESEEFRTEALKLNRNLDEIERSVVFYQYVQVKLS